MSAFTRAAAKAAFGVLKKPVLGGAIVGGVAGYAGINNQTNSFTSGLQGAALGAMAGFGIAKSGAFAKSLWKYKGSIGSSIWGSAKAAGAVGRFAFEHPLVTGGLIGGGMAMNRLNTDYSPTLTGGEMRTDRNEGNAALSSMTGGTSTIGTGTLSSGAQVYGALQDSTYGLVQGLHRSRH